MARNFYVSFLTYDVTIQYSRSEESGALKRNDICSTLVWHYTVSTCSE